MNRTVRLFCKAFLPFFILLSCITASAQQRNSIRGKVINDFTKESVPFASVFWKKAGFGITSDSAGNYTIRISRFPVDTLVVSYVGFADAYRLIRNPVKDSAEIDLVLSQVKQINSVEVKSKFSKGLRWWKYIVANKAKNNPYKYQNYAYELYNKMELDINNVSRKFFTEKKLMKPFTFILDNVDSVSDRSPFLPVYMTESLSDYYYSTEPHKIREEIKAAKTDGIKNEGILQFIGGINQKVNVYENFTNALGKEFISPLSDVGDKYYNYKGADTQYIGGQRYLHLLFTPKREGENTFSGDCWIHGGNWGIQRINLSISQTADINFVNRLSIVQEFTLRPDSAWMFVKDKTVIDFTPFGKEKLSFIARRSNSYKNVRLNDPSITARLALNAQKEEMIPPPDEMRDKDKSYWAAQRHEELSKNEQKVYKMMDTIKTIPAFIHYTKVVTFVFGGYKKLGKVEIGPWYKWLSGNQLEKIRTRFDLGTTEEFSKNLRLHGYLAYGFKDKRFKERADITYHLPNKSGITLFASYTNDLDNGRTRYNDEDITTDNLFSQLIRRQGIPQKFLGVEEIKLAVTKEWRSKFSVQPFFTNTKYDTYTPLPSTDSLLQVGQRTIISSEFGLRLRYAPGERVFSRHGKEIKLKSGLPVFEVRAAQAARQFFKSDYSYLRTWASITQTTRIPRWGKLNYMLYAGKIYTNDMLPFMLLEIHPGNEVYYYNRQSFNLMNRFEYVSDRFAGVNLEHNIEKKLLNLLPFMRKSNMRQFWNFKAVWGELSDKSRFLNRIEYYNEYRLRSLRGGIYSEIGTGFENIFKLFRIDFVWRTAPLRNIPPGFNPNLFKSNTNDFGIFGSVRLQF